MTEKEDAYLQLSVAELELSNRSLNGLQSGKIETIGQLVQWTEQGIMNLRFIGRKSLREIKQELARIGLTLKSPIGMITAGSQSPPDQIYGSTLIDSLEEKINVMEKAIVSGMWKSQEATNIIDRHELQITQLINSVNSVMALERTVKNLEEEIKQIKENFSLEWKKQYELGVELSNRYRELAGK
jgi:DNA-directed RNA polymerase alpha subunit